MSFKEMLRRLEKPVLFSFLGLWLLIYLLSRVVLEMYTDNSPRPFLMWTAVAILPFTIYASLRTAFSKAEKWFAFIPYLLIYTIGGVFITEYIVVNGDILFSAATKPVQAKQVVLQDVHKVFKRKLGFDHTSVTVVFSGKQVAFEARPYAYFYLQDKKTLLVNLGKSALGNDYVTSFNVSSAEKIHARWLHLKDWVYRFRILWGILVLALIAIGIKWKYFPQKPGTKPIQMGFWKLIWIVMGIIFAIGLLLYAGLYIYVTFFNPRI